MLKKILCSLALPATLTFAYALPARAADPPPPVFQNLGLPDTVFNTMVEDDCRSCHENADVVDDANIPNRHHLLIGEAIIDPTAAPAGTPGGTYECMSCHVLEWDGTSYTFADFRDCLACHEQVSGEASVHHVTAKALENQCTECHSHLDAVDDGHYIPSYEPSKVTPYIGTGTGTNGEGGCAFCHDEGTEGAYAVRTNNQTHHSTGYGVSGLLADYGYANKCDLCHDTSAAEEEQVRACENCHGVKSLHNIQADSDDAGTTITGGNENPYYGHIGHQDDCWGCHGFTAESVAPYAGPVNPDISGLSTSSLTAGFATKITVSGSAFTNVDSGSTLTSTIVLTDADGAQTALTPDSVTQNAIVVTIPATMAPGNYGLKAVKDSTKGSTASNKVNLSIVPAVKISSASCVNGVVNIKGSGFSQYVNAKDSGTGVSLPSVENCTVLSWSDTAISAQCGDCAKQVTVESVYGEAQAAVAVKKPVAKKAASVVKKAIIKEAASVK